MTLYTPMKNEKSREMMRQLFSLPKPFLLDENKIKLYGNRASKISLESIWKGRLDISDNTIYNTWCFIDEVKINKDLHNQYLKVYGNVMKSIFHSYIIHIVGPIEIEEHKSRKEKEFVLESPIQY